MKKIELDQYDTNPNSFIFPHLISNGNYVLHFMYEDEFLWYYLSTKALLHLLKIYTHKTFEADQGYGSMFDKYISKIQEELKRRKISFER